MSKRSAAHDAKSRADGAGPEFSIRAAHDPHPSKRRPWLLVLAAGMLAAWIGCLAWMALR